jgi:hypothetical protein
MRSIQWVALGPVAFLVHDAEEVLVIEPWLRRHGHALPAVVQPLVGTLTTRQFASAVAVLLLGYSIAAALAIRALRRGQRPWPYLLVSGAFVANGITHLLQSAVLGGYTPGVVTALSVSLPYGWMAGRALHRDEGISQRLMLGVVAGGLLAQVPLAWLALHAGRQLGAP